MKVTTIQKSIGWEQKTIAELMINLQTYEKQMLSSDESLKNGKFVAFLAEEQDTSLETKEPNEEILALITKKHSPKFLNK